MSAQESTINCAAGSSLPRAPILDAMRQNLAQSMVSVSCAGFHGNSASE